MDNFFKQFRENLDGRPEPDFKEQDWSDLEKRLEGTRRKRAVGAVLWWVAAPVCILSLMSNALFFKALKNNEKEIAVLQSRPDTVWITRLERRTDTVYLTKIVQQTVVKYLPAAVALASGSAVSQESGLLTSPPPMPVGGSENPAFRDSAAGQLTAQSASPNAAEAEQAWIKKRLADKGLQPLPTAFEPLLSSLKKPGLLMAEAPPFLRKQKKTIGQHLLLSRPTDFQVGINGGLAFPLNVGLERLSGRSLSLQGSVQVSRHLRLWAEGTWLNLGFVSNRMDEEIGIPVVAEPTDDFQFVKAETNQPMLQYAVGFQYLLNPSGRWKASVGLGYGAVSVFPYEVVYEFYNPTLGAEWSIDKSVQINELIPNFLHLSAGVERRLSRHWHWQIGLTYRTHFEDKGLASPRIFGVQSGLKFGF